MPRSFFSVFDEVYVFARLEPGKVIVEVPEAVITELIVFVLLSPLLVANLTRKFDPLLVATDASSSFGFGASACRLTADECEEFRSFSDKRGDYVRLERGGCDDDEQERPRVGLPRRLRIKKHHFTDLYSIKARVAEHAGVLEARGMLLLIRWWLRSVDRHSKRVLILVDAKSVLAATAKGRSGAPGFKQILRSVGAHVLAGDLLLYPLYVPSEDNPSDAPSRGKRFPRGDPRKGVIDRKTARRTKCPSCGVSAARHPLQEPRRLRGTGLFCKTARPSMGHAFRDGRWVSYINEKCRHMRDLHEQGDLDGADAEPLLDCDLGPQLPF